MGWIVKGKFQRRDRIRNGGVCLFLWEIRKFLKHFSEKGKERSGGEVNKNRPATTWGSSVRERERALGHSRCVVLENHGGFVKSVVDF